MSDLGVCVECGNDDADEGLCRPCLERFTDADDHRTPTGRPLSEAAAKVARQVVVREGATVGDLAEMLFGGRSGADLLNARFAADEAEREGWVVLHGDGRVLPGPRAGGPPAGPIPPVSDTQRAIARECDRVKALLLDKNEAYGDSATDPLRVFSSADADAAMRVRIDDKLSRIARGRDYGDEDTVVDLVGYLILLLVGRRR